MKHRTSGPKNEQHGDQHEHQSLQTSRLTAAFARVQVILQDDGCRRGIEPFLAFPPVALAQRQAALGLAAREPLVLERDASPVASAS